MGGLITQTSTWRWIYLFNGPCAGIALVGCIFALPKSIDQGKGSSSFSLKALKTVDYVGGLLILAATTLLVFAIQEAGASTYAWNSATIISSFTVSGACWIAFGLWLWWLDFVNNKKLGTSIKPIIPLKVLLSRPTGPAIMLVLNFTSIALLISHLFSVILLMGFPLWVSVVNLPQRFQIVYRESVIMAGVHLLPLLCSVALGKA